LTGSDRHAAQRFVTRRSRPWLAASPSSPSRHCGREASRPNEGPGSLCFTALLDALIHFPAVEAEESAGDDAGGFFERASARATNDQVELVFRPRMRLPRIADTSVAHMTYRGAMTKPSLPAVRGNDLDPSQTSPRLWCQHAEFMHAYDGPCLFSGCECPFFTPAEPDVVALW
jgi:hypothetical protein